MRPSTSRTDVVHVVDSEVCEVRVGGHIPVVICVRKIGQVWRNTANNPDTSQAAKLFTLPHHKPRNFLPRRITSRETFL
jgi:hypothetical protein